MLSATVKQTIRTQPNNFNIKNNNVKTSGETFNKLRSAQKWIDDPSRIEITECFPVQWIKKTILGILLQTISSAEVVCMHQRIFNQFPVV